jgi:hypothetical protein
VELRIGEPQVLSKRWRMPAAPGFISFFFNMTVLALIVNTASAQMQGRSHAGSITDLKEPATLLLPV